MRTPLALLVILAAIGCGNPDSGLTKEEAQKQEDYLKNGIDMSKVNGAPADPQKPNAGNLSPAGLGEK